MRWLLAASCIGVFAPPITGAAQSHTPASRLFLALGPAWSDRLTGFQLRVEYDLTSRGRALGLRVDAGGRWTPTQTFSAPSALYGPGSRFEGTAQSADLTLGLAATLTPWATARFSPYLVTGVAAVQSWSHSQGVYRDGDGSLAQFLPPGSSIRGAFAAVVGLGFRGRLASHPLRLEVRHLGHTRTLTLGTALRF